jgi:hypothetical protein
LYGLRSSSSRRPASLITSYGGATTSLAATREVSYRSARKGRTTVAALAVSDTVEG